MSGLQPSSNAGKIRQAIEQYPRASNAEISTIVGLTRYWGNEEDAFILGYLPTSYVAQVRRKFSPKPRFTPDEALAMAEWC